MAHLYRFRKGWQSEHLAKYILSKFSFIAEPSTISDDLGSDFFCTLFKIKDKDFLLPQNSFTIQIKTKETLQKKENKFEITKKRSYLDGLEIPFFVGVVDKSKLKLIIYSGEVISNYFSLGPPDIKKLFVYLVDKRDKPLKMWDIKSDKCYLKFPKVVEINANFDYISNYKEIDNLFGVCRLIQENIASKISREYIFKRVNDPFVDIYAGGSSAKTFRDNYMKRLAEVFFNLEWLYNNIKKIENLNVDQLKKEFGLYKEFYLKLKKIYPFPQYLISCFKRLDKLLRNK